MSEEIKPKVVRHLCAAPTADSVHELAVDYLRTSLKDISKEQTAFQRSQREDIRNKEILEEIRSYVSIKLDWARRVQANGSSLMPLNTVEYVESMCKVLDGKLKEIKL